MSLLDTLYTENIITNTKKNKVGRPKGGNLDEAAKLQAIENKKEFMKEWKSNHKKESQEYVRDYEKKNMEKIKAWRSEYYKNYNKKKKEEKLEKERQFLDLFEKLQALVPQKNL